VPLTVAEHLAQLRFAAPLHGADAAGEAVRGSLVVQVGIWRDAGGTVVRARYRASTCAALIAYAEAACALVEQHGTGAITAARLRASVRGVHPIHDERAQLVAEAIARAARPTPDVARKETA
jgi:hypothetical protein